MRLYLDTNAIIYLIESVAPFQHRVLSRILQAESSSPPGLLLTSRLARLECRVKPLRDNDHPLLQRYDAFFTRARLHLLEFDAPVIELATDYRARFGLKTPDALHLASAKTAGADVVLTGDAQLSRCTDVPVEVL